MGYWCGRRAGGGTPRVKTIIVNRAGQWILVNEASPQSNSARCPSIALRRSRCVKHGRYALLVDFRLGCKPDVTKRRVSLKAGPDSRIRKLNLLKGLYVHFPVNETIYLRSRYNYGFTKLSQRYRISMVVKISANCSQA